jgi:hypothetical protein
VWCQTLFHCVVCKVISCRTSKDNVQFVLNCFAIWGSNVSLVDEPKRLLASRHVEKGMNRGKKTITDKEDDEESRGTTEKELDYEDLDDEGKDEEEESPQA